MSAKLSEEEMRQALFGEVDQRMDYRPEESATKRKAAMVNKIRVTLHVTNVYEGDYEIVIFESPNLSKLVVEMDAKKKFKKKYRYVEVVAVERV
ncbi:hypothetical protein QEM42_004446 [Pseudomonas putida]|nr:hypothetical protein [Pseudomonas putida]ELF6208678.1 hypothetical protein [Pseudomonas putida]